MKIGALRCLGIMIGSKCKDGLDEDVKILYYKGGVVVEVK